MRQVRAITLLILCLAVLPWGAYAAPFGLRADVVAAADGGREGGDTTAIRAVPRCKGVALPGAACHPDLALAPAATALPEGPARAGPRARDLRLPRGRVVLGVTGPPRIG